MNDKIKLVHVIAGLTGGGRERRMVELVKGLNSNEFYEQYVILLNKAIDYPDIYKTDAKIIVIDYPSKLETTKVIFRTLKTLRPSICIFGRKFIMFLSLFQYSNHFYPIG